HGLLPLDQFIARVQDSLGGTWPAFRRLPSIFWLNHSDTTLVVTAWLGFALSCVVAAGYANAILLAVLWALYMSFVHLGQDWYGYGWEFQLLETGFLSIFLCPLLDPRPFPRRETPRVIIWLFRALSFRIMLGSGLIKIRGDASWRDLTALYYHFETQPIPNGLSRWFHFLPRVVLRGGTLFNHIAELGTPWFVFWPRIGRYIAGSIIVIFQITIILSGNLSFLNWLTILPALACFDDKFWSKLFPKALVRRAELAAEKSEPSRPMVVVSYAVAALIAILSIQPLINLVSRHQIMNTSFNSLDLVNTYGAFGTVGTERLNVIFEGTDSFTPDLDGEWKPYLYKGLPVLLDRRSPQIAPYQLRLDWQMWFAAMGTPNEYPWTIHLVWKLLHNDAGALSLFANNPFPAKPPRYVRAMLYRYKFAPPNDGGICWEREEIGPWLPPLAADNQRFIDLLENAGWLDANSR
ncbi:MAG: lipase maturation factor family protein, partial [Chthoniobacterales bacterium]